MLVFGQQTNLSQVEIVAQSRLSALQYNFRELIERIRVAHCGGGKNYPSTKCCCQIAITIKMERYKAEHKYQPPKQTEHLAMKLHNHDK